MLTLLSQFKKKTFKTFPTTAKLYCNSSNFLSRFHIVSNSILKCPFVSSPMSSINFEKCTKEEKFKKENCLIKAFVWWGFVCSHAEYTICSWDVRWINIVFELQEVTKNWKFFCALKESFSSWMNRDRELWEVCWWQFPRNFNCKKL